MPDLSPQSLFQRLRAAWNQVSIKWRVFAVFAAFTILVLVLLWLFQTVFLDQFYEHTKKTELVSATETVQRHIDDASLESILDQTAQQGQIYVAVLYADGRLIGSDYSPDAVRLSMRTSCRKFTGLRRHMAAHIRKCCPTRA